MAAANLGPLDRRIRIEQPTVTRDADYGSPTATWTTYGTFWASVQEVLPSRGESNAQDISIAERPARVRMRYVSGITAKMRCVYLDRSDRVMRILAVPVEIGRREGLEFMVADFSTAGSTP